MLQKLLRIIGHQQWLRFGIRDRIIRYFDNVDTRPAQSFTTPFFGKTYPGDMSNYIDWSTYHFGAYCPDELAFMRDALKNDVDPIVLDIGANVGHHSLFASTIAKHVHAFEPFPQVYSKIYEKININSLTNLTVHTIGLGAVADELPYSVPNANNLGTGSFVGKSNETGEVMLLPIRVGDEYLASLDLPGINLIKMDIEGFEPQALQGLAKTLATYRPIVLFEWSANERGLPIELPALFPSNYKLFDFRERSTRFGILTTASYKLLADLPPFNDGYKVAIPNEKVSKFQHSFLSPR